MKIIEGSKKEIILDDGDLLTVSALKGNKTKLIISAKDGILEVDDIPVKKIEQIREEENAIKAMEEFQKKNSNH